MIRMFDMLFIDVSNFCYRAYFERKNNREYKDKKTFIADMLTLTLQMLNRVERNYLKPDGKIIFVSDNSESGIRKRRRIDPEYKSNRTKQDKAFFESLNFFNLIIENYKNSYMTIKIEGHEADDIIRNLVDIHKGKDILLISNDIDWFRAISNTVVVAKYEDSDYKLYGPEEFEEKFGFPPLAESLCIYKAFRGDRSDNIPPGVKGILSEDLSLLCQKYRSIEEILFELDSIDFLTDRMKDKIRDSSNRLIMNYNLVDYIDVPKKQIRESAIKCEFNPSILHRLYKNLDMDIKSVDPRVYQFFPKKELNEGDFFTLERIPRA